MFGITKTKHLPCAAILFVVLLHIIGLPGIDKSSNTKHIYYEIAAITRDAIKIEDPEVMVAC